MYSDISPALMAGLPSRARIAHIAKGLDAASYFFIASTWARQRNSSGSDFVLGNPHEAPLPAFVDALRRVLEPRNNNWYAYKQNEAVPQQVIANSLHQRRNLPYIPEDIFLTNGAFAGISVTLKVIVNPGDEVIYISPPWFFYASLITDAGATPVRVAMNRESFDLDLDAIAAAITPRTRAIIVNTPNNPTGKIYPASTLSALARLLKAASDHIGQPIYLLADEAYSRIIFDGRDFPSPAAFYPETFVIYTYAKTLLTPGQRLGYIALSPAMTGREQMREDLLTAQYMTGWAFPNALLQHALPEIENLSIDVAHLQHKRDRMVYALRQMGYELSIPEGTFYLLARSPIEDDFAFIEQLAAYGVYCLPGQIVEMPGYFRISLTATDAMIERSLAGFDAARRAIQPMSQPMFETSALA